MKPMKGVEVDLDKLVFPLYGSPKIDGLRGVYQDGVALSNQLKPFRNKHFQSFVELHNNILHNLDSEITVGERTDKDVYRKTNSGIMSGDGEPNFTINVFDYIPVTNMQLDYTTRYRNLLSYFDSRRVLIDVRIQLVEQKLLINLDELLAYEEDQLLLGYEGIMLRSLDGIYKFGRSTVKQAYLLKLKRFKDSEAIIMGMTELEHNHNIQYTNELGLSQRSAHQDNKLPGDMMGNLIVMDESVSALPFEIGTGFTVKERQDFWDNKVKYIDTLVKYKYFPHGMKDKPRHPVYLGPRDKIDL